MSWEISHTPEAWTAVRENLEGWTREQLIEAITDDRFEAAEDNGQDGAQAADYLGELLDDEQTVGHDTLVDRAMSLIELHMTCTNGGHEFYIDREGCHTVPCVLDAG